MTTQPAQPPTLDDVMNKLGAIECELKKAELRDRVIAQIAVIAVGAGFVAASVPVRDWWGIGIGGVLVIIGCFRAIFERIFKWGGGWGYRRKP